MTTLVFSLLAVIAAVFVTRWLMTPPVVEAPVFDAEKACTIAASLDGANPEMAKVFAKGSLATADAFGIRVTVQEDCSSRIDDLKKANSEAEDTHKKFKEETEERIAALNQEIAESEKEMTEFVADNGEEVKMYERALQVFC